MPKKDPRIDAYIGQKAEFAQPILRHLRKLVHSACPDAEETIRWNSPFFIVDGKLLAGMAAFKAHCAFFFWNRKLVFKGQSDKAMGQFGRITKIEDLPSARKFAAIAEQAVALNKADQKAPEKKRPAPKVPADLAAALKQNPKAQTAFKNFSPSHQREYIEWITEAKKPETKAKRLETTLTWLTEGKARNWKYA